MQEAITLPTLSDTMETGRLIQWLKQPGDAVKKGDVLAEVETDKAVMDVEVFHDGYLSGPLAQTDGIRYPRWYCDRLSQRCSATGAGRSERRY